MDEKEIPKKLREEEEEENLSEETKSLISSLPSEIECFGIKIFKYQGCWYDKNTLQSVLNFHKSFQPQETDVIVASFPKSGSTWLKALTFALVQRSKHLPDADDHPLLSHNPHELVPFFETDLYLKSSEPDLTKLSSSPRLFSTHMPFHTLQVPFLKPGYSPCKIVYVNRNVKDALVSLWYFLNKFVPWSSERESIDDVVEENCTFESIFESFCRGVNYFGPFWDHVLSYWRGSLEDPKHVLFMRYEELKMDPRVQIKRLAEFLDCPFTKEEEDSGSVEKILKLCSLSNLSGLEINKSGKGLNGIGFHSYFRKGEVGDSKNYLTPEMETKIDMIIEDKLKGSGLKF